MKTRCPTCATTFRVAPEQLRARNGRVRCGQCGGVFNALDTLKDESHAASETEAASAPVAEPSEKSSAAAVTTPDAAGAADGGEAAPAEASAEDADEGEAAPRFATSWLADATAADAQYTIESGADINRVAAPIFGEDAANDEKSGDQVQDFLVADAVPAGAETAPQIAAEDLTLGAGDAALPPESTAPSASAATAEPATPAPASSGAAATAAFAGILQPPTDGGIMPRQMTEIPGYSKWGEGVIAAPAASVEAEPPRAPFVAVAALLGVLLVGQGIFALRSEVAAALPSLRPALESFAGVFGSELPPLRRAELIGIEGSDLQSDPARGGRLLLLATLANRAPYPQALPLIELTLTDTHDQVVARKVFPASEYLPDPALAAAPFAARSEIALRLWIETRELDAAGYRLYVFYP